VKVIVAVVVVAAKGAKLGQSPLKRLCRKRGKAPTHQNGYAATERAMLLGRSPLKGQSPSIAVSKGQSPHKPQQQQPKQQ
jgi:hypothetical protein